MKEKRIFKRFYVKTKVELKTKDGSAIRILCASLDNIGLGGIRILSHERMELDKVGKDVEITIESSLLDHPLRGKGKIKYIDRVEVQGSDFYAMGIQFTHINEKEVKYLIDKTFGWGKKSLITQQSKRELVLLLKILLIAIPIVWILLMVAENYSGYGGAGQKVKGIGEELIRAVDYFLSRR